ANVGGYLPHQFLVNPGNRDRLRLLIHRERNPRRRVHRHRVRITQRHDQLLPFEFRPVAHAFHLQRLGKTIADAGDHIADQSPRGSMQRADGRHVRRALDDDLPILEFDADLLRERARQLALRPFDLDGGPLNIYLNSLGECHGLLANAGHIFLRYYQTLHNTSPPTPNWRARVPVMTPLGVDKIAMPMPESTHGISFLLAYTRR